MTVDTSIYPKAPEPINPLQMMGQVVGLKNALLQNQLTQKTMGAQQAIGQDFQSATGPDGAFDPNRAATLIANDPNAAYGAADATAAIQAQRQAQLAQHTAQVDLAMKQTQFMAQSLGALADKQGVTGKDVTNLGATLVANGIMDPKEVANELAGMPANDSELPTYLRGLQMRAMSSMDQLQAYHNTVLANAGNQLVPANTAPLSDQSAITLHPSPEFEQQPREILNPQTGQQEAITQGQFENMAQNGPVATEMSPGQRAASTTEATGVTQDALNFENGARTVPDMNAALANMSGDLTQFDSGPGSSGRKNFMAAVNSIMGGNYNAERVASQEGMDKLGAQVAARQRQLAGLQGTDQALGMIEKATPGSALSKLGNQYMISIIRGNNDYISAENQAWQKYQTAMGPGASQNFHKFTTTFNKYVNPLVFQMQHMSEDQKKTLIGAMSSSDREKLAQSIAFAQHNGLLQ